VIVICKTSEEGFVGQSSDDHSGALCKAFRALFLEA
jgi:hypothetical protein